MRLTMRKITYVVAINAKLGRHIIVAFYERAHHAYAIIATGESAIYANVLLKKGVVQ